MPDANTVPVQRSGVHFEELEDEAVVYDRKGRRTIYLNETATVVWKLCDGERTVAAISALLSQEYPESAAEIERDIVEANDKMVAARVVALTEPGQKTTDKTSSA